MSPMLRTLLASAILGISTLALCTLGGGCATTESAVRLGGAETWSANCQRCHNGRSPSSYSDAEWEVALLHMRVRANLSEQDAQAIREFLLSAN